MQPRLLIFTSTSSSWCLLIWWWLTGEQSRVVCHHSPCAAHPTTQSLLKPWETFPHQHLLLNLEPLSLLGSFLLGYQGPGLTRSSYCVNKTRPVQTGDLHCFSCPLSWSLTSIQTKIYIQKYTAISSITAFQMRYVSKDSTEIDSQEGCGILVFAVWEWHLW